MNKSLLWLPLLFAAAAGTLSAQDVVRPSGVERQRPPKAERPDRPDRPDCGCECHERHRQERRAEAMRQFDKDGDGKLNPEERKAMREVRGARRGQDGNRPRRRDGVQDAERRQAILKRFDANGDGKLDDAEKATLRKAMEARRAQQGARERGKQRGDDLRIPR